MTRHAPIASLRLCAFALTVPMLLAAQTSNVETVRAWRRTHVMGLPGGTLRDPTGTIAEGQRAAAAAALSGASSNIVSGAAEGLTNALERLWAVAAETNRFTGRLYLAADMEADPDCENIEAYVVAESAGTGGLMHCYTHYTRQLAEAPRTVWLFELAPGTVYWAPGAIDTNAPLTNVLGYACYDIRVQRPPQAGNMILRTHRFLGWGAPDTPLDVSDDGIEIVSGGVTNRPYTGSVVFTNGQHEVTETYLSGFLYAAATNQLEGTP